MLGEYGIYGQIRAILTAMFNSLMPSLNSRSLPFVVFLGGFPSRCQNLSSRAIRPGGLLFSFLVYSFLRKVPIYCINIDLIESS